VGRRRRVKGGGAGLLPLGGCKTTLVYRHQVYGGMAWHGGINNGMARRAWRGMYANNSKALSWQPLFVYEDNSHV